MRKYLASMDNGNQTEDFEFYSDHRAGSKANIQDALYAWHKAKGWMSKVEVMGVWLAM